MSVRATTHLPAILLAFACALLSGAVATADAATAASAGATGPNVLVRPADHPVVSDHILLAAAGGEFESAQVVIQAGSSALAGVDVDLVGSLTGPSGVTLPADAITIYRVGYANLTGFASDGELGGALGLFPDALVPKVDPVWHEARHAFPIDVPAGENRLAWIDVLIPSGTPAGTYSGARLHVRDSQGSVGADLPIEIDVADMDLPSTSSLDGGFDINPNRLCQAHACGSIAGGQAALTSVYERVALDNRVTLAKPPTGGPVSTSDAAYQSYTRPLILGTADTRLRGARLTTVTIYQWATESADEWRRAADADGYLDRVRFHCDEIGTSTTAWTNCQRDWTRANSLWRGAAAAGATVSDLPLEVTTSIDQVAWARAHGFSALADAITVLIPVINYVHPKGGAAFPGRRAEFAAWDAPSKQLWSYTSCMSMGCSASATDNDPFWNGWPSYGVDQPASEARAMGWISYTYALRGEYYYETARDLPSAWTNLWSADGGNHGDGTLFYPGTPAAIGGTHDTAIESIRLKRISDGREDHELLLAAQRAAGRDATLAIARGVFATAYETNVTQGAIESARARLFTLAAGATPRVTWPVTSPTPAKPTKPTPPARSTTPTRSVRGATPMPKPAGVRRRIMCGGRAATIIGTARADVLRGTRGPDVIVGLGGNDRIVGLGGGDTICTGTGRDAVNTSSGTRRKHDRIICGFGQDRVTFDRADRLRGTCDRRRRR
jgi:hypothetical protein